jgi:hypothetical protein
VALILLVVVFNSARNRASQAQAEVVAEPVATIAEPAHPTPRVELGVEAATIAAALEAELPEGDAPPESRESRAPRRRHVRPEPSREREAQPAGFAFLTIGAEPYAQVRIDGDDIGVTPIVRKKISAGPHEIELISPDTQQVRLKKRVVLDPDEHQRITIP